tara:strand:- start:35168 stop:35647 length:480 start_codon:yes stop_codon:yes gene_type:complete
MQMKLQFLELSTLQQHEHIDVPAARKLARQILAEGIVRQPLLVAQGSHVILDGHHRFHALHAVLKTRYAPCVIVDYSDTAQIDVAPWRTDFPVSRADVLHAAETKKLLPIKSSRHSAHFQIDPCDVPLDELGQSYSAFDGRVYESSNRNLPAAWQGEQR